MSIQYIQEWIDNTVGPKLIVTDDISLLDTSVGFYSKKDIVLNATLDKVVVMMKHPNIESGNLSSYLNTLLDIPAVSDLEPSVRKAIGTTKGSKLIWSVFPKNCFGDVLTSKDFPLAHQVEHVRQVCIDIIEGRKKISISHSSAFEHIGLVVDWEQTFKGLNTLEIIQLMIQIVAGTYFTFPTTLRRSSRQTFLEIDEKQRREKLKRHPVIYLLERIQFREGFEVEDLSPLIKQIQSLIISPDGKTNHPICRFAQKVKMFFSSALMKLATENSIYAPFKSPHYGIKTGLEEELNWNTDIARSIKIAITKLPEVSLNKNDRSKSKILQFLRNTYMSTNIRSIADVPEDWPLNISVLLKNYLNEKGYDTASGFSYSVLKELLVHYEESNQLSGNKFPRTKLNYATARRVESHKNKRLAGEFGFAEEYLGHTVINHFKAYCKRSGRRNLISYLNTLCDWIEEVSDGKIYFKEFEDFKPHHFVDPQEKSDLDITFFEYLRENKDNNQLNTLWNKIHHCFENYANQRRKETGQHIENPVPPAKGLFKTNAKPTITVRDAMPQSLHDLCIEVLVEDEYKICAETFPSSKQIAFNRETGRAEEIINKTPARCLHFLLVVPTRGHQARWLDEGLLDPFIWDFESHCYVKNNHPLVDYKYADGKTHAEKFGKTGVFRNKQKNGNETLELYINTNKTQSQRLVEKGKLGYTIPWPTNTGVENIDVVWEILEKQRAFNQKYAPDIEMPCHARDEDEKVYTTHMEALLPQFTPLFREFNPTNSKCDPENRHSLHLPITGSKLRKLFRAVLKEAERRYKDVYPQYKNHNVAFDEEGAPLYNIHGLRVFGITNLIENGVSTEVVQMIVGHSVAVMTLYYNKIRDEKIKSMLLDAAKNQGVELKNQKEFLKNFGENNPDLLISLYDLVSEWNLEQSNPTATNPAPDFSRAGAARIVNGGVCGSFDCKAGGLKVKATKHGISYEVTAVEGGDFRCGNCRFWRSGPRFIIEQIYNINLIGEEISDIVEERQKLLTKQHEALQSGRPDSHLVADRFEKKSMQKLHKIAYILTELKRRYLMLKETLQSIEGIDHSEILALTEFGSNLPPEISGEFESLSKMDACVERTTQAAMLGVPADDSEVSLTKLEKFVNKALAASDQRNPFPLMVTDNLKRVALLYGITNCLEKLGRPITDEEFDNPMILKEKLGNELMTELVGKTLSLSNESQLLESINGHNGS